MPVQTAPLLVLLASLSLAAGCREAPAPAGAEVGETPAPANRGATLEAAPAEGTVPGTAAPLDPEVEAARKAARKVQLDALRSGLRKAHFGQQTAVPLPADAPDGIEALVPPSGKLVEFEIHRRMHRLAPRAGRRVVLRWLTRLDGALGEALARRTAGVWSGEMPPEGATTVEHPERGTLTWSVHTPDERATRVEMVLEAPEPEGPLVLPSVAAAPWRSAIDDAAPLGFEHGRYHARRGPKTYTDLERLSAIFTTDDGPGLQRRLEEAAIAAGYKQDDDDARLLRAPGEARTTFTTRLEAGRLTVHHQRRWRRAPSPEAPEGAEKDGQR